MHLESNEAHMHLESARQLVLSYSMKFEALPQRNFRTDIDLYVSSTAGGNLKVLPLRNCSLHLP